jgi:divalent metal cation (Fe/Co/Zn/Cd) transporter
VLQTATYDTTLQRRARHLAWATIAWNVVEAIVAIGAGVAAGSIALVGFGLDSTVEVLSSTAIVWQLTGTQGAARERRTVRLVALSFFALAAYVATQALIDLAVGNQPDASPVGIALAVASLMVMPALAIAKRRTGHQMHSVSVIADSNQTKICAYLSTILLAGLAVNATVGWWWADPLAALALSALAVREGRQAWRGDLCDDCC